MMMGVPYHTLFTSVVLHGHRQSHVTSLSHDYWSVNRLKAAGVTAMNKGHLISFAQRFPYCSEFRNLYLWQIPATVVMCTSLSDQRAVAACSALPPSGFPEFMPEEDAQAAGLRLPTWSEFVPHITRSSSPSSTSCPPLWHLCGWQMSSLQSCTQRQPEHALSVLLPPDSFSVHSCTQCLFL